MSGIGNAYSDEILHAAKMSPMKLTANMTDEEIAHLHGITIAMLTTWRHRLQEETGDGFPEKVTAFREGMAVHGRYGKPCPVCGTPVQRIRYAANEANYCPTCQTGGKLLADRSLSRLLKDDWPRSLEELEQRKQTLRSRSAVDQPSTSRSIRGGGWRRRRRRRRLGIDRAIERQAFRQKLDRRGDPVVRAALRAAIAASNALARCCIDGYVPSSCRGT